MQKPALLVVLLFVAVLDLWSAPVVMTVPATSNIFRAGATNTYTDPTPSGQGTYPVQYPGAIPAGPNPLLVLYFPNMTGSISYGSGSGTTGPDGMQGVANTSVNSLNGIAGISKTNRVMFLVGVFLGNTRTNWNNLPSANNYDNADSTVNFDHIQLGQTFFIGDGRTSAGQLQRFYVPSGATRLYLGFADAAAFQGYPGWYGDNAGAFTATLDFGNPGGGGGVPEPGTIGLVSMALLGLGGAAARGRSRPPGRLSSR